MQNQNNRKFRSICQRNEKGKKEEEEREDRIGDADRSWNKRTQLILWLIHNGRTTH